MVHKELQNAGKELGLKIWRVEKMDVTVVPTEQHGYFYTGDSYIVLNTISTSTFNVHVWHGNDASPDEKGCAAIFMTQLDDHLGGAPVQFTEFQYEESATFLSYFKTGLKYMKGGIESGFKKVVPNDANVKRLLHVKGRHKIRATEVECCWSSFNKGDCFIIDLGKDIFHWSGSDSNRYERLKTTELAIDIRDNERRGRAEVHMIDEGDEPEAVIAALGPKPASLPESSGSDESADTQHKNQASLYLVSDAAGSLKVELVADKNPFKQDMLSQNDCYILDNGGNKQIFLWKGQKATKNERGNAAVEFIKKKGYSKKTTIQIIPAGSETTMFKQFFHNWLDKDETTGPPQPRLFVYSNKNGSLTKEEVPGGFSQKDLIPDDVMILDIWSEIFVWIGKDANEAEKTGSGKAYKDSDPSGRVNLPIKYVKQGEEQEDFTKWFYPWDAKMWDKNLELMQKQK